MPGSRNKTLGGAFNFDCSRARSDLGGLSLDVVVESEAKYSSGIRAVAGTFVAYLAATPAVIAASGPAVAGTIGATLGYAFLKD